MSDKLRIRFTIRYEFNRGLTDLIHNNWWDFMSYTNSCTLMYTDITVT